MADATDIALAKLEGVRKTHENAWIATCPYCHRPETFRVAQAAEDFVYLRCYSGKCAAPDLLAKACGLSLANVVTEQPDFGREVRQPKADTRPEIDILIGQLPEAADQLERVLAAISPPLLYQRGGHLVETRRLEKATEGKVRLRAGTPIIADVNESWLVDRASRHARFFNWSAKKSGELVRHEANASKNLAAHVFAHVSTWPFHPLTGVIETPTILRDGRVIEREGYDRESGLLLSLGGTTFPTVPSHPTKDDAAHALQLLDETLLDGFHFEADYDRSAALAYLLACCGRDAFDHGPLVGAVGPLQQTGKSTLIDLGGLLSTGRFPAALEPCENRDELNKLILSCLANTPRVVCYSNIRRGQDLDRPAIAKVVTDPEFTARWLGGNSMRTFPTTGTTWAFSGIGIVPQNDLTSRTMLIRLNPMVARSSEVKWRTKDPRVAALARRGELVSAALTILKAHQDVATPSTPASRFTQWDQVIRGALLWLDRADPWAGMVTIEQRDPEMDELEDLIAVWASRFGTQGTTLSEVIRLSKDDAELRASLVAAEATDRKGEPCSRRLAAYLARFEGRIAGKGRICKSGTQGSRALWRFSAVTAVTAVVSTRYSEGGNGKCIGLQNQGRQTAETATTAIEPADSPENWTPDDIPFQRRADFDQWVQGRIQGGMAPAEAERVTLREFLGTDPWLGVA